MIPAQRRRAASSGTLTLTIALWLGLEPEAGQERCSPPARAARATRAAIH